jgi:hypothetical protein
MHPMQHAVSGVHEVPTAPWPAKRLHWSSGNAISVTLTIADLGKEQQDAIHGILAMAFSEI